MKTNGFLYIPSLNIRYDICVFSYENNSIHFYFCSEQKPTSDELSLDSVVTYKTKNEISFSSKEIIRITDVHYCFYIKELLSENKRRFERFDVEHEPSAVIVSNASVVNCFVLDYSVGGVKIFSDSPIKLKKGLFYTYFNDVSIFGKKTKIVWSKKISNDRYEHGLKFLE